VGKYDVEVQSSGFKVYRQSGLVIDVNSALRVDVNRYLKWAFAEAANAVALHHRSHPQRHVSRLYQRIRQRKGHPKAIGAVARHLAEAAFHVLRRKQIYRDPELDRGCTNPG